MMARGLRSLSRVNGGRFSEEHEARIKETKKSILPGYEKDRKDLLPTRAITPGIIKKKMTRGKKQPHVNNWKGVHRRKQTRLSWTPGTFTAELGKEVLQKGLYIMRTPRTPSIE